MKPLLCSGRFSSVKSHPCLWMQAGVVRKKACNRDYHCVECCFDRRLRWVAMENSTCRRKGLHPKGKRGRIVFWKEKLRVLPQGKRPCLHHMKGKIAFRLCTHDYHCIDCDFDQYFEDQHRVHAVVTPVDAMEIKGFRVPQGYYFHEGHTWAKIEDGLTVRIGMDAFALRLLGPLDSVESPLLGKEIQQGQPDIVVRRGRHSTKVMSPVSGVVTGINEPLREIGRLANADPYGNGWIITVHAKNLRKDIKHLLFNRETYHFLEEEIDSVYQIIEDAAGPLAADGGGLGPDIYGSLPQVEWDFLTRRFLRT